jgi:hypothetical protein
LDGLIDNLTHSVTEVWHVRQQAFTTRYVDRQRQAHPDKSVLVSCQDSDEKLEHKHVEETITLDVPFKVGGIKYKCYVFDSGEYTNKGDGGFINWCFSGPPGTFEQNGNHAVFHGHKGLLSPSSKIDVNKSF